MMTFDFSELLIAETIAFTTTSSGTRLPFEMKPSISLPSSEPLATSARSRSPVEKCANLASSCAISDASVVLPEPGAPMIKNSFYIKFPLKRLVFFCLYFVGF